MYSQVETRDSQSKIEGIVIYRQKGYLVRDKD